MVEDRWQIPLPTGTFTDMDKLPQMEIIRLQGTVNDANHHIRILEQKIVELTKRMEQAEKDKIVEFKSNDVHEINKRIERLEAKVALVNSYFFNNRAIQFCLRFFNR